MLTLSQFVAEIYEDDFNAFVFCRLDTLAWIANFFAEIWFFDKFEKITHELRWWANFNFENLSQKFFADCDFLQILILNCTFRPK